MFNMPNPLPSSIGHNKWQLLLLSLYLIPFVSAHFVASPLSMNLSFADSSLVEN